MKRQLNWTYIITMIKKINWTYVIALGVMAILSFTSISWISKSEITSPPWWAVGCSIFCFLIGLFFLVRIVKDVFQKIGNYKKIMPCTNEKILEEFNNNVKDAKSAFNQFKISIRRKEIIPGTPEFKSFINEIGDNDYKAQMREYFTNKRSHFVTIIAWALISVILIFSFFYIADYTLEYAIFHRPGFDSEFNIMQKGDICGCFLDGVYYSVVTFATLGYGDIHPGDSTIAKIISIAEVSIFIFFFGMVINMMLSFMPISQIITARNLKFALKEELEKYAGDF